MNIEDPPTSSRSGQPTGARALAAMLAAGGVSHAFAYPGTSELALCHAIQAGPSIRLHNSRGDREAVFLAAGANLVRQGSGVAVLHGARGLTNALGAIADARRNEIPLLCLVGLPSRSSAAFLPPHGEHDLISSCAGFARAAFECGPLPAAAAQVTDVFSQAWQELWTEPYGPVLVGLPQDALEGIAVAADGLASPAPRLRTQVDLGPAIELLKRASRPVILVDDYALRVGVQAQTALNRLSEALAAPVIQVAYRRGAMLFSQIRQEYVPRYAGQLDRFNPAHSSMLDDTDLLITVEDRNMYPRVVGTLPPTTKIAVTSNVGATTKNGYLTEKDLVVQGAVVDTLNTLTDAIWHSNGLRLDRPVENGSAVPVERPSVTSARRLVGTIARALSTVPRPFVVDDSQMFGGLIARNYDLLPPAVTVAGSHGGFVGGGIATAVGAAIADPSLSVVCTLGDQGFTNGVQGLAAAGESRAPLVFLLCDNGMSVSLSQQLASDESSGAESSKLDLLRNNPAFDYAAAAESFGLAATKIVWPLRHGIADAEKLLANTLQAFLRARQPSLIQLVTPADRSFWHGIWRAVGLDEISQEGERDPG